MKIALNLLENHEFPSEMNEIKVLDLPAGNGWIGVQLEKTGYQVVSGMDPKNWPAR